MNMNTHFLYLPSLNLQPLFPPFLNLLSTWCTRRLYSAIMALNEFIESEKGILDDLLKTVSPAELMEYRNEVRSIKIAQIRGQLQTRTYCRHFCTPLPALLHVWIMLETGSMSIHSHCGWLTVPSLNQLHKLPAAIGHLLPIQLPTTNGTSLQINP